MSHRSGQGALVWLLIGLFGLIVSWLWLVPSVRTQMSNLAGRRVERQQLEERIDRLNELVAALGLTPGTAGALPVSLADLERSLPPTRQLEDLYAMIEKIAQDLGMAADTSIRVDLPSAEDTSIVAATPVQIVALTSYDAGKQLLDRLTTTLRPLSIDSVTMAPTETGAVSVTVQATAYTRSTETVTSDEQ